MMVKFPCQSVVTDIVPEWPTFKLTSQHKVLPGLRVSHASQVCIAPFVMVKVKAGVSAHKHRADVRLCVLCLVGDKVIGSHITAAEGLHDDG